MQVGNLAFEVYNWIFDQQEPPANILTRDYARGVIERAAYLKAELPFDISRARPPYRSRWPGLEIPSPETLAIWKGPDDTSDEHRAKRSIYNDLIGESFLSDFPQYEVGQLDEWSSRHRTEPKIADVRQQFVDSLTKRQREWFRKLSAAHEQRSALRELPDEVLDEMIAELASNPTGKGDSVCQEFDDSSANANATEKGFLKALRNEHTKLQIYAELIAPNLGKSQNDYRLPRFDRQLAGAWMLGRVIELGWTSEMFSWFDNRADSHRDYIRSGHSHRIGAKYQRIALYEMLGRISDHFKFLGHSFGREEQVFEGPWQLRSRRELDASMLLEETRRIAWHQVQDRCWWSPSQYLDFGLQADSMEWLKRKDDVPSVMPLIDVQRPERNEHWLSLDGYHVWDEPVNAIDRGLNRPRRRVSYNVSSFLIRGKDRDAFLQLIRNDGSYLEPLPRPLSGNGQIYLGEFFWAPAFDGLNSPYHERSGWWQDSKLPVPILCTIDRYSLERSSGDFSLKDSVLIDLPCKFIADGMGLVWNGTEGKYSDKNGNIVAFDPSVEERGPGALLIRRETMAAFLRENNYELVWIVEGEKNYAGGSGAIGRLNIRGVYQFSRGDITGSIRTSFESWPKS